MRWSFAPVNLTKPCKLAPRLEERAVAGCAADANSWLGLLPERVRAWRFRQGSRLASSVKGVARAASCVTRAPASRRGGAGGPSPPALNLAASAGKRVPGGGRLSYGSPFSRGRKPLGSSLPGCLRPGVQRGQRRVKTDLQRRTPAAPQGLPPGPRHVGRAPGTHFLRGCTSGRRRTPSARPTSAVCFVRWPGPRALALPVPRVLT